MHSRSVRGSSAISLPLMALAVATGVAAGLLLAPANGSTIRANLRERAADAGWRLRRYAGLMYDRVQQSRWARQHEAAAPLTATIGEITSATQSSHEGATS